MKSNGEHGTGFDLTVAEALTLFSASDAFGGIDRRTENAQVWEPIFEGKNDGQRARINLYVGALNKTLSRFVRYFADEKMSSQEPGGNYSAFGVTQAEIDAAKARASKENKDPEIAFTILSSDDFERPFEAVYKCVRGTWMMPTIKLQSDDREGALWVLIALLHPRSPRRVPIGAQNKFWGLAAKLGKKKALEAALKLNEKKEELVESEDDAAPTNGAVPVEKAKVEDAV